MRVKPVVMTILCGCAVMFIGGCDKKEAKSTAIMPASKPASFMPVIEKEKAPDIVLVTINNKTLMRSEAQKTARENAMRQGIPPQMIDQFMAQAGSQFEQQSVQQFVNRALLDMEVEKQKIEVSEKDVVAVIEKLKEGLPAGMTIEQALATRNMTMERLRTDVAVGERIQKLYKAKTADAKKATDAEVEAFYNENKDQFNVEEGAEACHILIECDEKADEAAHAKAKTEVEEIRKQLLAGADFAKLAAEKSACPSKAKGGSLGTFKRGQMVPEFDTAVFTQKIGEIGPVVKTPYGYHIIKVTDRKEAGQQSLKDVAEDIKEHLTAKNQNDIFGDYLETLRKQADIKYAPGYEPVEDPAAGAAPEKAGEKPAAK